MAEKKSAEICNGIGLDTDNGMRRSCGCMRRNKNTIGKFLKKFCENLNGNAFLDQVQIGKIIKVLLFPERLS